MKTNNILISVSYVWCLFLLNIKNKGLLHSSIFKWIDRGESSVFCIQQRAVFFQYRVIVQQCMTLIYQSTQRQCRIYALHCKKTKAGNQLIIGDYIVYNHEVLEITHSALFWLNQTVWQYEASTRQVDICCTQYTRSHSGMRENTRALFTIALKMTLYFKMSAFVSTSVRAVSVLAFYQSFVFFIHKCEHALLPLWLENTWHFSHFLTICDGHHRRLEHSH